MSFEINDDIRQSLEAGQPISSEAPAYNPMGSGGIPARAYTEGGGYSLSEIPTASPYMESDPWSSIGTGPSFAPSRVQATPSMVQGEWKPEADWGEVLGSVFTQYPMQIKKEFGALVEGPARILGLDSLASIGRQWSHEADTELQKTTPNMGDGTLKSWVYQAGTSILQNLTAGGITAAAMGPRGIAAAMARGIGGKLLTMTPFMTMSGAGKYADMREAGFSNGASWAAAVPYGLIDGATELIGFSQAVKPGLSLAKRLAYTQAGELAGELTATPLQFGIDKMTTNPEYNWDDFWKQMRDTAATTPLQSAVMGLGGHALNRFKPKQRVELTPEDKVAFGNALSISMGNTMEAYREIERTKGPERARQYLQMAFNGVDPTLIAEPLTRRQIEEKIQADLERQYGYGAEPGTTVDEPVPVQAAPPAYTAPEIVQPAGVVPQPDVGPGGIPARTPITQTPPETAPGQRAERVYGRDGMFVGWRVVNDVNAPLTPPAPTIAQIGGTTLLPNQGVGEGALVTPTSLDAAATRMNMVPAVPPGVPLHGVVPDAMQVPTGQQAMALARVIFPGSAITQEHVNAAVSLMQQLGPRELQARLPAPPPSDPAARRDWDMAFGFITPDTGAVDLPGFGREPIALGRTIDGPIEGFGQGQPAPPAASPFKSPPPKAPLVGGGPSNAALPNIPRRGKLALTPAPGMVGKTASGAAVVPASKTDQGVLTPEGAASSEATPAGASSPDTGVTYTPGNQPIQFRYRAVEAGNLITSNNPDMGLSVNPAFPPELQPRSRDRLALKLQVDGMVSKLNPARVAESAEVGNGAPIIGPDMIVEVGNGRTVAIKRIYGEKQNDAKAREYKSWLVANAEKYGLDAAAVNSMAAPVLVRERTSPVADRTKFVKDANVQTVAAMGAVESGRADAERMTDSVLASFDPASGLLTETNKQFVRDFMATVPETERNALVTADGNTLTPEGIKRIKDAVLYKAYGDASLLNRIAEEGDEDTRNLSKAILESAAVIAKYRAMVASGIVFNRDISPQIVAAANKLNSLKKNGENVYAYIENQSLLDDTLDKDGKALLAAFESMKRSKGAIETFIDEYTQAAMALGDPNQQSMLEQSAVQTTSDLIQYAYDRATEGKNYAVTIFTGESEAVGTPKSAKPAASQVAEDVRNLRDSGAPGRAADLGISEQRPAARAESKPAPVAGEKAGPAKQRVKRLTVAQQKRAMDLMRQDSALSMREAAARVRAEDAAAAETPVPPVSHANAQREADLNRELRDGLIYNSEYWYGRHDEYVKFFNELMPDNADALRKDDPTISDEMIADRVSEDMAESYYSELNRKFGLSNEEALARQGDMISEDAEKRRQEERNRKPAPKIEAPAAEFEKKPEFAPGDHVVYNGREMVVTGIRGKEYIITFPNIPEGNIKMAIAAEGKDLSRLRVEHMGNLKQTVIPGMSQAENFQLTAPEGEIGTSTEKPPPPEQTTLFEPGRNPIWDRPVGKLPDFAVKALITSAGFRYDGKWGNLHQFTIVSDANDPAHKITWTVAPGKSLSTAVSELNDTWRNELGREITVPFRKPSTYMPEGQQAAAVEAPRKKSAAEKNADQAALDFYGEAIEEKKEAGSTAKTLSGNPLPVVTVANAYTITDDLEKKKATDFRGRNISTPEQVAIAAGLIRDPRVETVLVFYMKGDTVVGNFAVTSGAANYVALSMTQEFANHMKNQMKILGADGYYLVHNHPTGFVNPSGRVRAYDQQGSGDLGVTQELAEMVPGLKSHVIIDHGIYTNITVDQQGKVAVKESLPIYSTKEISNANKVPSVPSPFLGRDVHSPGEAAALMADFGENPAGYITAIYPDAAGLCSGIQHLSADLFIGADQIFAPKKYDALIDLLQKQSFAFGSPTGPVLYGNISSGGTPINPELFARLIKDAAIQDFVHSGTLYTSSAGEKHARGIRGTTVDAYPLPNTAFGKPTSARSKQIASFPETAIPGTVPFGGFIAENNKLTSTVLEGQPFLQEGTYETTMSPAAQRAFPLLSNQWIDKAIGTMQNWKDVNKSVRDGDISNFRRTMQQPFFMREKYPLVGQAQDIELERQAERSALQIKLTGDVEKSTIDKPVQNPIMDLSDTEEAAFRKIVLESTTGGEDNAGVVFTREEVLARAKKLGVTNAEAQNVATAYEKTKTGYDQAMKIRSQHMEEMLFFPYQHEVWVDDLKALALAKEADLADVMAARDIAGKYSKSEQERLLRAVSTIREPFNMIKQFRREMGRIKYYVPLEHGRGEFVVRIWEKGEGDAQEESVVWSYRTETKAQAAQIIETLKRNPEYADLRGKKMTVDIEKGTPESLYQRVYDDNLYRFMLIGMERMKAGETYSDAEIDGFIKNLSRALSDELKARGFGARMIQRRAPNIKGYELKDQRQAFLDYMSGLAGIVTKQKAAAKYQALLKEIPKNMPNLYDFVSQYSKDMMRNPDRLDRGIDKMKMLATMQYIAGNLRLPLVQITQNFVLTVPEMSRQLKRAGYGAGASLTQAHSRIVGAAWDIVRGKLTKEEAHNLALMTNQGITEAKFLQEIYGRMQSKWASGFAKIFDYVMYPFMWLERMNRQVAFLAMHRLGVEQVKKKGLTMTEDRMTDINKKAVQFVFATQVLYGKANQPEPMRGAGISNRLLSLAYTFKQYPHHYLAYLKEAIREGHGATMQKMGDDVAKLKMSPALVYQIPKLVLTYMKNALTAPGFDSVMLSMAWISAFGGVLAWPFVDDILELYERMTGKPVRAQMKRVVHSGFPTMFDMDISNSLKIGAPWTVGTNFGDQLSQSALGVYGGLATNYGKAISQVWAGNFGRGLEYALPTMLQYPMKAVREYTDGATTGKGRQVFDAEGKPKKLDTWQAFLQAGGIKSAEMGEINRDYRTLSMMTAHYTEERGRIFEAARKAMKAGDAAAMDKVRSDMTKYNMEIRQYGGAIPPIQASSFSTALREMPNKRQLAFIKNVVNPASPGE